MRAKLEVAGAGVLLLVILVGRVQLWQASKELHEATTERDSVAAEFAAERARAEGRTVEFAQTVDDLEATIAAKDSSLQRVLADYRASRITIESYSELLATAENRVSALGDRLDSLSAPVEGRWGGKLDDGLLRASWRFVVPPARLDMDYTVTIDGKLIHATAGDGRLVVTAWTPDDRASLEIPALFVEPRAPDVVHRTDWSRLLTVAAGAFLAGGFGWELVR